MSIALMSDTPEWAATLQSDAHQHGRHIEIDTIAANLEGAKL